MATPRDSSKRLYAAVKRLTGETPRKVTHRVMFRVRVDSADGHPVAVTVQVDTHRKRPSAAAMNDLADRLRLPRGEVDQVLAHWTPDDLRRHLGSLSQRELLSWTPR